MLPNDARIKPRAIKRTPGQPLMNADEYAFGAGEKMSISPDGVGNNETSINYGQGEGVLELG